MVMWPILVEIPKDFVDLIGTKIFLKKIVWIVAKLQRRPLIFVSNE